jgi:hypothetical protein
MIDQEMPVIKTLYSSGSFCCAHYTTLKCHKTKDILYACGSLSDGILVSFFEILNFKRTITVQ